MIGGAWGVLAEEPGGPSLFHHALIVAGHVGKGRLESLGAHEVGERRMALAGIAADDAIEDTRRRVEGADVPAPDHVGTADDREAFDREGVIEHPYSGEE